MHEFITKFTKCNKDDKDYLESVLEIMKSYHTPQLMMHTTRTYLKLDKNI